jgi:hypothetical protein
MDSNLGWPNEYKITPRGILYFDVPELTLVAQEIRNMIRQISADGGSKAPQRNHDTELISLLAHHLTLAQSVDVCNRQLSPHDGVGECGQQWARFIGSSRAVGVDCSGLLRRVESAVTHSFLSIGLGEPMALARVSDAMRTP